MLEPLDYNIGFVTEPCVERSVVRNGSAAVDSVMLSSGSMHMPLGRGAVGDLLVAVGRSRDRAAFATLFAHFAPKVKAYLIRLGSEPAVAEELTQEVMITVWRRAETFDPRQASAGTWIYTVARNKRIDAIRRERRPEFDPSDPALVPDDAPPADRVVADGQTADAVGVAIATLPDEQAALLRLAYFEDKSHSEIAELLGLPLGTVKSRLRLAMTKLKKTLVDIR